MTASVGLRRLTLVALASMVGDRAGAAHALERWRPKVVETQRAVLTDGRPVTATARYRTGEEGRIGHLKRAMDWTEATSKAPKGSRSGPSGNSGLQRRHPRRPSLVKQLGQALPIGANPLTTKAPREITPRPCRLSGVYPRPVA